LTCSTFNDDRVQWQEKKERNEYTRRVKCVERIFPVSPRYVNRDLSTKKKIIEVISLSISPSMRDVTKKFKAVAAEYIQLVGVNMMVTQSVSNMPVCHR